MGTPPAREHNPTSEIYLDFRPLDGGLFVHRSEWEIISASQFFKAFFRLLRNLVYEVTILVDGYEWTGGKRVFINGQ